mmetsp:Transcript_96327/g.132505  ORF Transcript_96327/g.132505 Transcript_96327/m.132505 type:complete len:85 (+) Transcript_96327:299-553(+)
MLWLDGVLQDADGQQFECWREHPYSVPQYTQTVGGRKKTWYIRLGCVRRTDKGHHTSLPAYVEHKLYGESEVGFKQRPFEDKYE